VITHPHYIKLRSNWLKKPFSALAYQHWLVDEASLTGRLQRRYTDFNVLPQNVCLTKPMLEEAVLLRLKPRQYTLVREVLLMGNKLPVVFAHSVLPASSLRGAWKGLGRLGNKPLGAALFKNPKVIRTPLSYKKLSKNHALYQKAVKYLDGSPTYLWSRRSVFSLNCANITVTEVFLPNLCHE
jgi:chorismate lyase